MSHDKQVIENEDDAVLDDVDADEKIWLTIKQAAEYGNMSVSAIYDAIGKGLSAQKNEHNVTEVEKNDLEKWFCPFKQSIAFRKIIDKKNKDRQKMRIQSLLKRNTVLRQSNDDLRKNNTDLREENRRLEAELNTSHDRESKILKILGNLKSK